MSKDNVSMISDHILSFLASITFYLITLKTQFFTLKHILYKYLRLNCDDYRFILLYLSKILYDLVGWIFHPYWLVY